MSTDNYTLSLSDSLTYPPKMTELEKRLTPEDFRIAHRSLKSAIEFRFMNALSETDYRRVRNGINGFHSNRRYWEVADKQ